MDKHATIKLGEYTVPLIGIPEKATLQKCVVCRFTFHLSDIILDERCRPHCRACMEKKTKGQE